MPLPNWCVVLTVALVGVAVITDVRWRRIPNSLTFMGLALAIVIRFAFQGWAGLGLALSGAIVAPLLLLAMHGGKGLGMGDLKLAMAVGAIVGPLLAVAAMLIAAIAGGVMAVTILTMRGRGLAPMLGVFMIGLPFRKKAREARDAREGSRPERAVNDEGPLTMPYGVAIGAGSLITLAACWWTGQEAWILSFV
jgi:prepilin peptidase CpaA